MNSKIEAAYRQIFDRSTDAMQIRSVGGGSINSTYSISNDGHECFVKVNSSSRYPGMFEAEMAGLELLKKNSAFTIPECLGIAEVDDSSFLFMSLIKGGNKQPSFWREFGKRLADMHAVSDSLFGLNHDNYIGSLPQSNRECESWSEFFINERIMPLMKMAVDSAQLGSNDISSFERLATRLDDHFPVEKPSLLHGDLWSGNYMVGPEGEPALIDPAVYYGHRYMDLGMMQLFGGFDQEVFEAYKEHYALDSNWREGTEIANLYPLLVHVILFGGGYASSVRSVLQRYA